MSDEQKSADVVQLPSAASAPVAQVAQVSPTGTPMFGQWVTRAALFAFGVAGAIAMAPAAGVDVSFLPPLVPKVCALVAFVAATVGLAGPGVRK